MEKKEEDRLRKEALQKGEGVSPQKNVLVLIKCQEVVFAYEV